MGQEREKGGGSAAGSDLIRDLRDVGTGRIKHIFAGTCPEVWEAGTETEHDRADPQDECKACDVLRRADDLLDQVSDRSDIVSLIDSFREELLAIPSLPDVSAVSLDTKLLKIRGCVEKLDRDFVAALQEIKDFDLVRDL